MRFAGGMGAVGRRRTSWYALLSVVAAGIVGRATPVGGQEAAVEVRAGRVVDAAGVGQAGLVVAPSVRWTGGAGSAGVGAEASVPASGAAVWTIGAATRTGGGARGLGGVLLADAALTGSGGGAGAFAARVRPMVGYGGSTWRVAAGPHLGLIGRGGREAFPISDSWPFSGPPRRASREVRPVIGVAAEGHGTVGSVWWTVAVAGVGGEAVGWRDADVAVGFDAAPVAIALEAGVRRGASSGEWVGIRAVGRVTRSFAMVGRAGRHHPDAFTGRVGGTRVEVGVRLVASSRADPLPTGIPGPPPPSDGMHRLTIRARAGADVRLVADWTNWRAVPVPETDPGVFSAGVRLGTGTHRFAFIVDGRWRTPDGYPTEPDGYGGEHAVVRVTTRG